MEAIEVPLDSITALNPIVQDPVIYTGTLTGGYTQATGNSHTKKCQLARRLRGPERATPPDVERSLCLR